MITKTMKKILLVLAVFGCLFVLPAAAEDGTAETTFFEALYEQIENNAEAICSFLALCGSVLVAVLYKNGLHPLLTRAIGGIRTEVGNLKTEAGEMLTKTDAALDGLNDRLCDLSSSLGKLEDELQKTEEVIISQDNITDRKVFGAVLDEEVNLLYDIFMSTSLPEYQKNAVGERVAKMKKEIAAIRECDGDEA